MKDFTFLFSIILLVSCGSPEQQSKLADRNTMSFSVDTVMVDPGEEIVFLNRDIYQSFLSSDRRYLYNFNPSDNSLEKIDLNELRFEKKIPFEKEGESLVPELTKVPARHFAKDGKIWIFENIGDEMGFVRMSFEL